MLKFLFKELEPFLRHRAMNQGPSDRVTPEVTHEREKSATGPFFPFWRYPLFYALTCLLSQKRLMGLALVCCFALYPNVLHSASTASVTLQWSPNSESDLAGYKMYYGTHSGVYDHYKNVGMTTSYHVTHLEPNKPYYFTVTAYDTSGNESSPSQEISKTLSGTENVLSISINGRGMVTSNPVRLSCSTDFLGTCSGGFLRGMAVTLTAFPNQGSTFSGWSGACAGVGACSLILSSSTSVTANFSSSTPSGYRKAAVLWRNMNSGAVAVWQMNGTNISSSQVLGGASGDWSIEGVGDVNGDGYADIVWRHSTKGTVAIWLLNGLTIHSVGVLSSVASS